MRSLVRIVVVLALIAGAYLYLNDATRTAHRIRDSIRVGMTAQEVTAVVTASRREPIFSWIVDEVVDRQCAFPAQRIEPGAGAKALTLYVLYAGSYIQRNDFSVNFRGDGKVESV